MSEPTKTGGSAVEGVGEKPSAALDSVRKIAAQLMALTAAQFTIWKLQAIRIVVLGVLGIPAMLGFFALAVYCFILLDKSADAALRIAPVMSDAAGHSPEWFSPLVRGGCYGLFILIVINILWSQCIGSFSESKESGQHAGGGRS